MSNPKMSSLSASNNNLFFFPPHDPLTPRSLPPTPLSSNRDGLERVEVPDTATLHDLREAIQSTLNIPYHDQYLSRDRALLTPTSSIAAFKYLLDDRASLAHLGVSHGDMIYLKYSLERTVAPLVKSEPVGETVSLSQLVARWVRIETQKTASCSTLFLDAAAAGSFQSYVSGYQAFSIKRGGIMYGTIDEESGNVHVEAIYEPPQQGSAHSLTFLADDDTTNEHVAAQAQHEMEMADQVAYMMGLQRVGWVFSQSVAEREHALTAEEVVAMARMQQRCAAGKGVTAVVSLWETEPATDTSPAKTAVHFEAFQVSDQLVELVRDGWVTKDGAPAQTNQITMRNPKHPEDETPLIVERQDVGKVDVHWFLLTIPIQNQNGNISTTFPVENRMTGQSAKDLGQCVRGGSVGYARRLRDFHLLLWLAGQGVLDVAMDLPIVVQAAMEDKPLLEGYRLLIDSLAEV